MGAKPRVAVVGLDGGTWELLRPLMKAGVMPNLARLVENGAAGVLHSTLPPWTPTAWSSFATGKNPGKHGVFGFTRRNADGSKAWVSSKSIRAATLWRILSDHGMTVGLLNVPLTYPPEEVDGYVVSGFPTPDKAGDITYPSHLLARMEADLGPYAVNPTLGENLSQLNETTIDPHVRLQELKELTQKRGEALFWLMDHHPTDFLMLVFVASDRIQHAFWKWLDPSCPEYNHPKATGMREKAAEIYRLMDELLGRLQERLGEGGYLFVVSDHGFGPQQKLFLTNKWLSQTGLLRYKKGKRLLRAACEKANLWDNRLFKLLAPALAHLKDDYCIDWPGTRAHGGRVDESGIYFNSSPVGSSPAVKGGARKGASNGHLAQEVMEELLALRDPGTGEPVVEEVVRREEVYAGPFVQQAPNLLIKWSKGYYGVNFDSIRLNSWIKEVRSANGDHREDGIFAGCGAAVKRGVPVSGASIMDLAPTILHVLGLPVPEDMDGRVLAEIFDEDFVARHPVASTTSAGEVYESPEDEDVYSAEDAAEIQKRLEALGYLD